MIRTNFSDENYASFVLKLQQERDFNCLKHIYKKYKIGSIKKGKN